MTTEVSPIERAQRSFAGLEVAAERARFFMRPDGRHLLVDGSMYSPSTRAIFGASVAWSSANDEEWETYEGELEEAIENYDKDGCWLGWEDGCLWLYGPDYEDEEA